MCFVGLNATVQFAGLEAEVPMGRILTSRGRAWRRRFLFAEIFAFLDLIAFSRVLL